MLEYSRGSDGKILWCWECKRKLRKGELIHLMPEDRIEIPLRYTIDKIPYSTIAASGKFKCKQCYEHND